MAYKNFAQKHIEFQVYLRKRVDLAETILRNRLLGGCLPVASVFEYHKKRRLMSNLAAWCAHVCRPYVKCGAVFIKMKECGFILGYHEDRLL